MKPAEIGEKLREKFPELGLVEDQQNELALRVPARGYRDVAVQLRHRGGQRGGSNGDLRRALMIRPPGGRSCERAYTSGEV